MNLSHGFAMCVWTTDCTRADNHFCCICCCKVLLINVWLHIYIISNWETVGLVMQPWYQRGLLFLLITLIFSCNLWSFALRICKNKLSLNCLSHQLTHERGLASFSSISLWTRKCSWWKTRDVSIIFKFTTSVLSEG